VTHDQVEAMTMGERVAVMRKGELQQVAGPEDLYERPVNLFVAGFIGSPAMNLLDARLERRNGGHEVVAGDQRISLGDEALSKRPALKEYEGRELILGIRPEALEDAEIASDAAPGRRIKGELEVREALGPEVIAHVKIDAREAVTEDVRELAGEIGAEPGGPGALSAAEHEAIVVGRFDPNSRAQAGDSIEMTVDTRSLHFFDPETSLGIYDGG
jgi:multiple sugar transport system ATP-binding protein